MFKNNPIIPLLIIVTVCVLSCQKIVSYPPEPEIKFESFKLKDTVDLIGNNIKLGELIFSFIDGDGDIGLGQPDSIYENDSTNINLFFTLFDLEKGEFIEIEDDDLETPLNYRIPFMERTGQNKTLQGEIQVNFEYYIIRYDTIKYDFYITDREQHLSNIESTDTIVFN